MLNALIQAVTAKNGSDSTNLVEEKYAVWLNSTDHGDPANDVTMTTDGTTDDDIHVTNATYVVCWWKGTCVAVYFTATADQSAILRAIEAGEPEELPVEDTWDDGAFDDNDETAN